MKNCARGLFDTESIEIYKVFHADMALPALADAGSVLLQKKLNLKCVYFIETLQNLYGW
jgi:hypothetical protein